jgi:hypothetical protein
MSMRKSFLFVLLPLLVAGCTTLPPWKPVPTGQSAVYGQIQDSRRAIAFVAFAGDPGIVAITVDNLFGGFNPRYGLIVDEPARTAMREAVAKFQEWSRLAQDNRVEITREINTINVPQMFRRGEGWEADGTRDVAFVFSSRLGQTTDPRITLVMRTSSFFYGVDQVVMNDQQAADFGRYLENDEVDAGYQQAKKKQDTLDMFK